MNDLKFRKHLLQHVQVRHLELPLVVVKRHLGQGVGFVVLLGPSQYPSYGHLVGTTGLEYDEGPFYQTQRFDRYEEIIQQLMDKGLAYRCNCSKERLDDLRERQMQNKMKPRYDGKCRHAKVDPSEPHVIRFKNPTDGVVVVEDMVRGKVVFQNTELDDLIIKRTDGSPTYNLTVVVDDDDMGITHVIRGDDHLNNTPRQINMLKALGKKPPVYAHLPMILGDDGARLSKRHGAVSVMQYYEDGYLPEALLNYLVRLGWSYEDQEIFSTDEMIQLFNVEDVNKAASSFNTEKLLWLNHHYIKASEPERIAHLTSVHLGKLGIDPSQGADLVQVVEAQRERAHTLVELAEISQFYYRDFDEYDPKAAKKSLKQEAIEPLQKAKELFSGCDNWQREELHGIIKQVVSDLDVGFGKVAMPLRVSVTGGAPSPDLDLTLYLVGKEAVLRRIDKAIDYIQSN